MIKEERLLEEIAKLESKLKTIRRKGNLPVESQICGLLGKKYELLGNWRDAIIFSYFDSEICSAMDDHYGQLNALNIMALLYQK